MTKKPVIGITCNYSYDDKQPIAEGIGMMGQHWQILADDYIVAIENAGGIPLIIPFVKDIELVKDLVSSVDGILLTGGNDIDPKYFGQRAHPKTGKIIPHRDAQDLFLAEYVIKHTDKPVLGICRGLQVLNVVMGGTLQHHIDTEKYNFHTYLMYPKHECTHTVVIQQDSLLYDIIRKKELGVNSFHHQAIDCLGKGLSAVAADTDGLIEAVELSGNTERFVLAVQWHPETMVMYMQEQQEILNRFVAACLKSTCKSKV